MAYVPINTQAFVSAYAGALSGMAVSGWVTDNVATDYETVTEIAGAFAQAFDLAWNDVADLNNLQIRDIVTVSQQEFVGRGPSLSNPEFLQSATWAVPAAALVALVQEADAYFTAQGIDPGTPSGGGSVSPTQHLYWLDPAFGGTPNGSIASPFTLFSSFWAVVLAGAAQSGWSLMLPATNDTPITPDAIFPTLPEILKKVTFRGFGGSSGQTQITGLEIDEQAHSPSFAFYDMFVSLQLDGGVEDPSIVDCFFYNATCNFTHDGVTAGNLIFFGGNASGIDAQGHQLAAFDGCTVSGDIVCSAFQFTGCTIAVNTIVPGTSGLFVSCTFAQACVIDDTNDVTISFDPYSYASFVRTGGSFINGTPNIVLLPSNEYLIATFGNIPGDVLSANDHLGPFMPNATGTIALAETIVAVAYDVTQLSLTASLAGGVTGTTTVELYVDEVASGISITLNTGQSTALVAVGNLRLAAGAKLAAKVTALNDTGVLQLALGVFGRSL